MRLFKCSSGSKRPVVVHSACLAGRRMTKIPRFCLFSGRVRSSAHQHSSQNVDYPSAAGKLNMDRNGERRTHSLQLGLSSGIQETEVHFLLHIRQDGLDSDSQLGAVLPFIGHLWLALSIAYP